MCDLFKKDTINKIIQCNSTLYVLSLEPYHENSILCGIFDSEEKALKIMHEIINKELPSHPDYTVKNKYDYNNRFSLKLEFDISKRTLNQYDERTTSNTTTYFVYSDFK